MKQEQRALRVGLWVIAMAIVLRILGSGLPDGLKEFLRRQDVAAFLMYLETGRVIRTKPAPIQSVATDPTLPDSHPTEPQLPVFYGADAEMVEIYDFSDCAVDVPALLEQPLSWDLTGEEPTVLILHSHATESYTPTQAEAYTASGSYRTLDAEHNMVRVGAYLKTLLEARGIGVIHDTSFHDYPSYNDAYGNSRRAVEAWLEQYPSIRMVLDLHRDAGEGETQLTTASQVAGKERAGLMLVVGTDAGGLYHPLWEENMSLAVKLQVWLEQRYPGACRPICFRAQRFNQDLSTGALLVEMGAAGDTLEEALGAAELLAEGISSLARGTADRQAAIPAAAQDP